MRVYLDNCSLQRPLDSRTRTRVILEAEAILSVLTFLESGRAEEARADCFCTCDDRFLGKAKVLAGLTTRVVSPVELIEELEQ